MTGFFDLRTGHEQVIHGADDASGLRCIIAIHSTALGPALGGTRFFPYSSEEAALQDVLRLSEGMSYKAACAGLDLGGGKGVIIGDPAELGSEALFRAYGRIIESLNGRYITACDVGTFPRDMTHIARETRWATGGPAELGGSGDSGVLTAWGVFVGMQATATKLWGSDDLSGRHVAVQGLGKVGRRVAEHLLEAGARISVADVDTDAVAQVAASRGVSVVGVDEILEVEADLLSPNAMGNVLNARTIPGLRVAGVCGGANNQLGDRSDAVALRERGILYAPDYVVNAGGVITVSDELHPDGHNFERCKAKTGRISDTLAQVFAIAERDGVDTETASESVARSRMEMGTHLRAFHLPDRQRND